MEGLPKIEPHRLEFKVDHEQYNQTICLWSQTVGCKANPIYFTNEPNRMLLATMP
jgi:hypothetical protein